MRISFSGGNSIGTVFNELSYQAYRELALLLLIDQNVNGCTDSMDIIITLGITEED